MKFIAILLVKFYRKFISPLFPAKCRYYPTCSSYALTAFGKFGFFRGFLLSAKRILRCNPWSPGGIDYVPDKFTLRTKKMDFGDIQAHDDPTPDGKIYTDLQDKNISQDDNYYD